MNITIDTYLLSITDENFLVEGVTPAALKDILTNIKSMKPENVKTFLQNYSGRIKKIPEDKMEESVNNLAKDNNIEKDNVTTSRVMLKRALGSILVGVPATLILPISVACLIACIIRTMKNKESIIDNTTAIIKEIKTGIQTTRKTNITQMEKAVITAGQTTDYLWSALSDKPLVIIKNLIAFIGLYIASIYYFWKGIVFAGEGIKK
jgi:hypothetical protein